MYLVYCASKLLAARSSDCIVFARSIVASLNIGLTGSLCAMGCSAFSRPIFHFHVLHSVPKKHTRVVYQYQSL
jgi:hypothetical protein